MQEQEFAAALRGDGFNEVVTKFVPHAPPTPDHTHPFDVRALVLEGAITLTAEGQSRTYGPGEVFVMEHGRPHAEAIGPDGVRYVVGRRVPAG